MTNRIFNKDKLSSMFDSVNKAEFPLAVSVKERGGFDRTAIDDCILILMHLVHPNSGGGLMLEAVYSVLCEMQKQSGGKLTLVQLSSILFAVFEDTPPASLAWIRLLANAGFFKYVDRNSHTFVIDDSIPKPAAQAAMEGRFEAIVEAGMKTLNKVTSFSTAMNEDPKYIETLLDALSGVKSD